MSSSAGGSALKIKRSRSLTLDDSTSSKRIQYDDTVSDEDPPLPTLVTSISPPHSAFVLEPSLSEFSDMVKMGVFVDKSSAILDFLAPQHPVHLILRPRRSGKTTLLCMIRDFFELTNTEKQAQRKDLFIKNNLAITKDHRFETEFGKYPVLYLDFSNIIGTSMENMYQEFKEVVVQKAKELNLGTFRNSHKLRQDQQESLDAILNGKLPESKLSHVLSQLTAILHALYDRKVIVLIDEYDTPAAFATRHGYGSEAEIFFRVVFSRLLKSGSTNLRGALLVGILPLAKTSWLSGVNNINIFPLGESAEYATACMFTEAEIESLYNRQNKLKKLAFEFQELKEWYNGYSAQDGTKLYNPWSISNALTQGRLGRWWCQSGHDAAIQTFITNTLGGDDHFRELHQMLLEGHPVDIVIDSRSTYTSASNMTTKVLWTLLYYAGYLTNACPSSDHDPESNTISACIPNLEIRTEFRQWVQIDFDSRMTPQILGPSIILFNTMADGKFIQFAKNFRQFIWTEVPSRILGGLEAVYQNYLYAYFRGAALATGNMPKWTCMMEEPTGVGRADMIFHQNEKGIIIEVRRLPHAEKEGYRNRERVLLSRETTAALKQCETRHYHARMPDSVKVVQEYGLAFMGQYCGIEAHRFERLGPGEQWIKKESYTVEEDEEQRKTLYCRPGI